MKPLMNKCYSMVSFLSFTLCILMGCASSSKISQQNNMQAKISEPTLNRPYSEQEIKKISSPLNGNLPLGIGARIDIFVRDTAEHASNVYNSFLRPLRAGKVFRQRPYEIDYAILPKRGDVYSYKNKMGELSIRSDYEFRLGVTRRFHKFSDFLTSKFWLDTYYKDSVSFSPVQQVPSITMTGENDKNERKINLEKLNYVELDDLLEMGKK